MKIRHVRIQDLPRLKELFERQGFDYDLPDFTKLLLAEAVVDENDVPVMAVGARLTTELFFLCDNQWSTPGFRMESLKLIHESMRSELQRMGIADAVVWLPPKISQQFGRRLMKSFGWKKNVWPNFSRFTDER